MDRAERAGLGAALAGHVALLALLSLGLVSTAKLPPIRSEPIDVQFVDEVGRQSAAPATTEAPAPSEAPKLAKPAEPPPPAPEPEPEPTPPKPEPAPKPKPKPAPPQPAPKPAKPKETAEKPAEKPAPRASAKPAPAAKAPARPVVPATPDERGRRRPDRAEEGAGSPTKAAKAAGSKLGPDFLKGIADTPKGKAQVPKAATVSALQLSGLAAAIKRQVQPCYELGSLGGTPAMSIVTVLRLQFNRDGTVIGTPAVSDHNGINDDNRAYTKQMDDVARRAVLRCAPLRLPPDLYDGGWSDIELTFRPGQMG